MTETRKSKRLQLLERGITKEVRMNESVNYLDYANSPLMWAAAALAVAVVVFQSILFMKRSMKAASESALTTDQVHKAIKSSVISSIGPSVVILVTMISLLVTMGAPVAWMRLSFIGSVNMRPWRPDSVRRPWERHFRPWIPWHLPAACGPWYAAPWAG